jgi:sialic acid synthase SpsE
MARVTLGGRTVDGTGFPYIVAEIGVNHEGSMDLARRLVELAKEGGADAAKFQTYKAGKIASRHSPAYWDTSKEPTQSQHALFQKYDAFGAEEYQALAEHCRSVGIEFLSTPFDTEAVNFLDPLVSFFKIASADLTNVPLLRRVAEKGKPVLLSTGASSIEEIQGAVSTLHQAGCPDIVLLHCVLNYPCADENANLNMIRGLGRAFPDLMVGYSDHTAPDDGMRIVTAAWLLGAAVIEKHFTHDKRLPGNDHYHAMDVDDLKRFKANITHLIPTLGAEDKAPLPSEEEARRHARRSIVPLRDIAAGEKLAAEILTTKRPAHGVSPVHWDEVLGRKAARALKEDQPLQWEDLT